MTWGVCHGPAVSRTKAFLIYSENNCTRQCDTEMVVTSAVGVHSSGEGGGQLARHFLRQQAPHIRRHLLTERDFVGLPTPGLASTRVLRPQPRGTPCPAPVAAQEAPVVPPLGDQRRLQHAAGVGRELGAQGGSLGLDPGQWEQPRWRPKEFPTGAGCSVAVLLCCACMWRHVNLFTSYVGIKPQEDQFLVDFSSSDSI